MAGSMVKARQDAPSFDRTGIYQTSVLLPQEMDRKSELAISQLIKWMQGARMDINWVRRGFEGLNALSRKHFVVASQIVRVHDPELLRRALELEICCKCEIGEIGKSSVELRYVILLGTRLLATGSVVAVITEKAADSSKASVATLPDEIKALAALGCGEDKRILLEVVRTQFHEPPWNSYCVPILVRYSDEDVNIHANHSAMARFLEDARETALADEDAPSLLREVAAQTLCGLIINYIAEVHAEDYCMIHLAPVPGNSGAIDAWAVRSSSRRRGAPLCVVGRGRLLLRAENSGNQNSRL